MDSLNAEVETSTSDWFGRLRDRFLEVARRRVAADAVEDVVQEALRVVADKVPGVATGAEPSGRPTLAWCFQVLRNVIGNHYQRERTRREHTVGSDSLPETPDVGMQPLEALESKEAIQMIVEALRELERLSSRCAHYLRSIAAGATPRSLASADSLEEPVLYRRIYRCRQRLRQLLNARGIEA